jgi:hypothetical protein
MANPRSFGTLVAWAIVLLLRYVWPPADRFFQTLTDAEVGALMVGMLLVGIVVMALPVRSKGRPIEQWTATETDRREPPSTRP